MDHCLKSKGYINLIVGSKNPGPNWLSPEQADLHCAAGISVWKQFSTDEGKDPDVVLVGCGVEVTTEVINAVALLKKKVPNMRIRVVNIVGQSQYHQVSMAVTDWRRSPRSLRTRKASSCFG